MDNLYREEILDHYRNPRNAGTLDPNDFTYEDLNPLCGDEIRVDGRVRDGRLSEVRFSGRGCAVSQASASILMELVEGQSLEDVAAMTNDDLLEELGIPVSAARMKCAMLGLHVLRAGLSSYQAEHPAGGEE